MDSLPIALEVLVFCLWFYWEMSGLTEKINSQNHHLTMLTSMSNGYRETVKSRIDEIQNDTLKTKTQIEELQVALTALFAAFQELATELRRIIDPKTIGQAILDTPVKPNLTLHKLAREKDRKAREAREAARSAELADEEVGRDSASSWLKE